MSEENIGPSPLEDAIKAASDQITREAIMAEVEKVSPFLAWARRQMLEITDPVQIPITNREDEVTVDRQQMPKLLTMDIGSHDYAVMVEAMLDTAARAAYIISEAIYPTITLLSHCIIPDGVMLNWPSKKIRGRARHARMMRGKHGLKRPSGKKRSCSRQ